MMMMDTVIKCLKGQKCLGSLFSVVEDLIVSVAGQRDRHAVLFSCLWTAKKGHREGKNIPPGQIPLYKDTMLEHDILDIWCNVTSMG